MAAPHKTPTLRSEKRRLTEKFHAAGLPFAQQDAAQLIMAVTGLDAARIILDGAEPLLAETLKQISDYERRRLSGEPTDHILGWRDFYGRQFHISRDVLSPRGDTEILIEHSLAAISEIQSPHLLDLGTGSGAILITLLAERPDARGVGIDISEAALCLARSNAKKFGVDGRAQWLCGDWFAPLQNSQHFDAIISNPPYITRAAMQDLEPEVSGYDPHIALFGGDDGLDAYRQILRSAQDWLTPHGWLGCEIGYDQNLALRELFRQAGLTHIQSRKDMNGHDRVVFGNRAKP